MFNLSIEQVHNLLRSTYCHWQGPAITRNSCFGNQLIWAGRERLLGPAGRKQLEDVSWTWAVCFPTALPSHLDVDFSPKRQLFQPAAPILHPATKRCCRMSRLCLLFPPGAEASFLAKIPKELCHRKLLRVSTKGWETSYQLPSAVPCSLSRSVCQGQLSSALTELWVSQKGATALPRHLVAALREIPWRLHQQERLGRKIGEREDRRRGKVPLMALNVTSSRPGSRSSAGANVHLGTTLSKSSF